MRRVLLLILGWTYLFLATMLIAFYVSQVQIYFFRKYDLGIPYNKFIEPFKLSVTNVIFPSFKLHLMCSNKNTWWRGDELIQTDLKKRINLLWKSWQTFKLQRKGQAFNLELNGVEIPLQSRENYSWLSCRVHKWGLNHWREYHERYDQC